MVIFTNISDRRSGSFLGLFAFLKMVEKAFPFLGPKFCQFHAFFGVNLAKLYFGTPSGRYPLLCRFLKQTVWSCTLPSKLQRPVREKKIFKKRQISKKNFSFVSALARCKDASNDAAFCTEFHIDSCILQLPSRYSDSQISRLALLFSPNTLETVALQHLGISQPQISTTKADYSIRRGSRENCC